MKAFDFYLDAWKYCYHNDIELDRIERRDWSKWVVDEDE